MPSDGLTGLQAAFVREYPIDQNATQAAIRAGYSVPSAGAMGRHNLTVPAVRAALASVLAKPLKKREISLDRVLEEWSRLAFSDIRGMFTTEGCKPGEYRLRNPEEVGDDLGGALASMEVVRESVESVGDGHTPLTARTRVSKVRVHDKVKALTVLSQYVGLLPMAHGHTVSGSVRVTLTPETVGKLTDAQIRTALGHIRTIQEALAGEGVPVLVGRGSTRGDLEVGEG